MFSAYVRGKLSTYRGQVSKLAVLLGFLVLLALMSCSAFPALAPAPKPAPEPIPLPKVPVPTPVQPEYKEIQLSLASGQVYDLHIYAKDGSTIEGSWKGSQSAYAWYRSPSGIPMSLGSSVIAPPDKQYVKDGPPHMVGTYGESFSIRIGQGDDGYYTFYLMPFDKPTDIILRYRVK